MAYDINNNNINTVTDSVRACLRACVCVCVCVCVSGRKLSAVDLRRADDSNSYVARVSSRHQPHILFYTDRVWCSVKGAAGQATNAFLELTCLVACQHLDLSKQGLYLSLIHI